MLSVFLERMEMMENPLPANWPRRMHTKRLIHQSKCVCVYFFACDHYLHETSKLHQAERRTADSLNIYKRAPTELH